LHAIHGEVDRSGTHPIDGFLSLLEVYSYATEPISPFPPCERLRLHPKGIVG
jgi:hypothetical protein